MPKLRNKKYFTSIATILMMLLQRIAFLLDQLITFEKVKELFFLNYIIFSNKEYYSSL